MLSSARNGGEMLHPFNNGELYSPYPDVGINELNSFGLLNDYEDECCTPEYAPIDLWLSAKYRDLEVPSHREDALSALFVLVNPIEYETSADRNRYQYSNETSADEDSNAAPYHPFADHSYYRIENSNQSFSPDEEEEEEEEEKNVEVDVWTREVEPPPPETLSRMQQQRRNRRRNTRTAKSGVSICKAVTALKRTRSQCYERSRKVKKIENSVETTPSNSVRGSDYEDYEDVITTRNRGAKYTAIKAINSINSNSKNGKSEVQRTNHNRNEKKRREQMSDWMQKVKDLVPLEYFSATKNERAKLKASKQKILNATRGYINREVMPMAVENEKLAKAEKKLRSIRDKNKALLTKLQDQVKKMYHVDE